VSDQVYALQPQRLAQRLDVVHESVKPHRCVIHHPVRAAAQTLIVEDDLEFVAERREIRL